MGKRVLRVLLTVRLELCLLMLRAVLRQGGSMLGGMTSNDEETRSLALWKGQRRGKEGSWNQAVGTEESKEIGKRSGIW